MQEVALDYIHFFWLLLIACLVAMVGRRIRIPYAIALVLVGLLVGAPHLLPKAHLDPHVLFAVLLPPLLFESALNIHLRDLEQDWKPIALYAFLGTFLATLVTAGCCVWLFAMPWAPALLFGSLISTTDPISVVAVFKKLGVGKRLSVIVEAESLFNDGIAVVVFGIALQVIAGKSISTAEALQSFLYIAAGGAAVGAAIGAFVSRITREFDDHLLEIMLTALVAYGSYLCAESLHASGVFAVLFAGLLVRNYGVQTGMSPTTRIAVRSFWEFAGFLVNSIVFLLIGIEVTFINLWEQMHLVLGAAMIVLFSRASSIYGLYPLVNMVKGNLPVKWCHVFWWGGLRGALSMALALGLSPDLPWRDSIVTMTFGVVLFSLLVQGLSVGGLIKKLGLVRENAALSRYHSYLLQAISCKAALQALGQKLSAGVLPRVSIEPVMQEYDNRLAEFDRAIQDLHLSDSHIRQEQLMEARRSGLLAEKSALQEALHRIHVDESTAAELMSRIDNELEDLDVKESL